MSMQRRHFELIAETIKRARFAPNVSPFQGISEDAHSAIAREFAQSLKATNPQFNTSRFLAACGVED
jgi:hypothetical protein